MDFKEMENVIIKRLEEKLEKVKQVQEDVTSDMFRDTLEGAPPIRGDYIPSISKQGIEEKDGVLTSSVFSNLKVGGNIPKWVDVPLAAFAEWGTGPMGEDTNTYPHGYPYTTNRPWNAVADLQFREIGTWGTIARPHFYPALQKAIPKFKEGIKKVMKE